MIAFLSLFCRAFLEWATSEGQRKAGSSATWYKTKVAWENACLSICDTEVACGGSIVIVD